MHAESTSDIDEDFVNALALLHSTEENSTEELRRMLDACIEKKYGPGKTLAARMPKRFLQNIDNTASPMRNSKKRNYTSQGHGAMKNEIWDDSETVSLLEANITENKANYQMADIEVFEVNYECYDDEDVPRISIPDEGFADGIVCKICNGAKLGALILLECQECQDAYHPLCHQPPVIDIDVYDPRFVWRCRRCVKTSSMTLKRVKTMKKRSAEEVQRDSDTIKEKADIAELKKSEKRNGNLFEKNGTPIDNTNIDHFYPGFQNLLSPVALNTMNKRLNPPSFSSIKLST
nr:PREDICTED: integrator complex subunit 12-like [Linepithema humile]